VGDGGRRLTKDTARSSCGTRGSWARQGVVHMPRNNCTRTIDFTLRRVGKVVAVSTIVGGASPAPTTESIDREIREGRKAKAGPKCPTLRKQREGWATLKGRNNRKELGHLRREASGSSCSRACLCGRSKPRPYGRKHRPRNPCGPKVRGVAERPHPSRKARRMGHPERRKPSEKDEPPAAERQKRGRNAPPFAKDAKDGPP
jgi:hypothetical protein